MVFNELKFKDYEVYIGKTKKGEIDFVATKNKEVKYIQVCTNLSTQETIDREFNAFNDITDSNQKYVLSLDTQDFSKNGIKHINVFDFLMNDAFLKNLNLKLTLISKFIQPKRLGYTLFVLLNLFLFTL